MAFTRAEGVTIERSGARTVVCEPDGERTALTPAGALVWELLAQPAEAEQVVAHLLTYFPDADVPSLQADVRQFLNDMRAAGLVVEVDVSA